MRRRPAVIPDDAIPTSVPVRAVLRVRDDSEFGAVRFSTGAKRVIEPFPGSPQIFSRNDLLERGLSADHSLCRVPGLEEVVRNEINGQPGFEALLEGQDANVVDNLFELTQFLQRVFQRDDVVANGSAHGPEISAATSRPKIR